MHLRDLGLKAGAKAEVAARADVPGNVSAAATATVTVSAPLGAAAARRDAEDRRRGRPAAEARRCRGGGSSMNSTRPTRSAATRFPLRRKRYLAVNHLWNAKDRTISPWTWPAMNSSPSRSCCAAAWTVFGRS